MNKIPNIALKALMGTNLSNLALVCLVYFLTRYDEQTFEVQLADMRRDLGYSISHGTYYKQIRSALTELNGTFIQFKETDAPVAASIAGKCGRNVVFTVALNQIFFDFQKNEKGQVSDFTVLPKPSDLKKLRAKYHMRLMLLALRWQSGGIVPTMSLMELKQWFCLPKKWKPSETLDALVCAERIVLSLGLSVSFFLLQNKKSVQVVVKKVKNVQITNERPTEYRKRIRFDRRQEKLEVLSKLLRQKNVGLANFARAAADKYRGRTFELSWLNGLVVHIESSTGLLITKSGRYLSEENNKRFYSVLMAKEGIGA